MSTSSEHVLPFNRARRLFHTEPGPIVQPSILDCDFSRLAEVVGDAESAGVRMLHFDVMDGHFVPNLSYGPLIVRALRPLTQMPFDCHLMISEPEKYVDAFAQAGADMITIHAEAVRDARPVLKQIRKQGVLAGIAINPPTAVESIAIVLDMVDLVLCMSVMPGFGGQKFNSAALEKFRWLKKHGPTGLLLQSDGGINRETIGAVREAGCDLFVVGSALFRAENFREEFQYLQSVIT